MTTPATQALTTTTALATELATLWSAVTAGDLSTAERHTESELVECPMCREGSIEAADYCNIDAKALGVQFYGIGPEHGAHERLWTAVISNFPAILAALTPSALSGDDLAKGLRTSQKALDEIARQEQANIAGYLALRDFPIGSASTEGEGE